MCSSRQRQLLVLCALRVDEVGLDWQLLARVAQRDQGLELLHRGEIPETSRAAAAASPLLRRALHGAGLRTHASPRSSGSTSNLPRPPRSVPP